jgi:hypothetical protein
MFRPEVIPWHLLRIFPDEKMKMMPVAGEATKKMSRMAGERLLP